MKLLSGAAIAVLCASLCLPEGARAHPRGADAPYVVSVQDETGQELRTFHQSGQTFVLGRYGDRYNIRVQNRTGRRVEAVISVDGRDVVSGGVGDFVAERGHLIDAYDEVLIQGFRQTWDDVAAFRFSSPGDSYSARMGTPQNVGVIGVAMFPERVRRVLPRPMPIMPRRETARSAPRSEPEADDAAPSTAERKSESLGGLDGSGSRSLPSEAPTPQGYAAGRVRSRDNLGTEYGESVDSSVQEVDFERADKLHPAQLIALRYDDRDGLIARGIIVEPRQAQQVCRGPQPFPNSRFAPPPPRFRD